MDYSTYYNPYANIPLDNDLFNYYEITQNYFDKTIQEMVPIHNDHFIQCLDKHTLNQIIKT